MTLGLTAGTNNYLGLTGRADPNYSLAGATGYYGTNVGGSASVGNFGPLGKGHGVTTDSTKSGIVADLSSGMSAVIKY